MKHIATGVSCPGCKALCQEEWEEEVFPYGEGGIEIVVEVPVIRCATCDFAYTDERAEKLRHAAICSHLGLLTPEKIRYLRKTILRMTRDTFHAAYGLSPASVDRWENGKLIQNEAADTLMRALEDPVVARRLDRRNRAVAVGGDREAVANVIWGHFPALAETSRADVLARSKDFSLRVKGC